MLHPRFIRAGLVLSIVLGLTWPAPAAVMTWIRDPLTGPGLWTDIANWDVYLTNDTPRISNGGTVVVDETQSVLTGFVELGPATNSSGTLRMTGGNLNTNFDIRVGGNATTGGGTGLFEQSGGSISMNGGNFVIGFGTTADGTYNMSGGSLLLSSGPILAVGNRGVGRVNQTGGTVYVRGASNNPVPPVIQLGRNSAGLPGSGTYTLSGGTAAALNVQFGSVLQTSGTTSTNTFNLQGTGTLLTNTISVLNTAAALATNTFNFTGGTLSALSIGVPLTNNGGTLSPAFVDFTGAPGDFASIPINPIATTTFTGANSYVQNAGGILAIDLAALGSNDMVDIGAGASLALASLSGTILVQLVGGFEPAVGSTFDILTADAITNTATVSGQTPQGHSYIPTIIPGADGREILRLTVVVPEPRTSIFLAGAGLALCLSRHSRRAIA